jgi:Holliday junction resolvase RusA-like endonuclease
MKQVSITLPMPHAHLSPNSRCHWAQKSKAKKAQRTAAAVALHIETIAQRPLWKAANVQIEVTPPDRRRRDKDNLLASLKAAFDGAQDAGLIADDSGLTYLPITIQAPDKQNAGVKLTFTKTR